MISNLVSSALRLVSILVFIIVIAVLLGWFMDNAALAGSTIGEFGTSVKVFITSLISASPVG